MHPSQIDASKQVLGESQNETFPYDMEAFGIRIRVHKDVFSPKHFHGWEIFTKNFPDVKGKDVLEVGCGTGVTALAAMKNGARSVVAVDINPHAVANTRENAELNGLMIDVRESDVFSAIRPDERFDVIYWNMPFIYVPDDYEYASVLERGLFDPGYRLTEDFLEQSKKFLRTNGTLLVGTGDFGDVPRFMEIAERQGYRSKLLAKEDSVEIHPVDFQLYELTLADV